MSKHRELVTIIKRSCITNKVVWIYRGASREAGRRAYLRACKKEVRRIRQWTAGMAARQRALMQVVGLGDSSSSSSDSICEGMTPEQKAAVKEIFKMSLQPPPLDREFYDHIVEESRRRNWQSARWKENRTKKIRYGKYK